MNKIWLIIQREVLNRVQKKSFIIATILLPLIFPAIMAILVYVAIEQKKNATKNTIHYVDENYDEGNIIFQENITISEKDTPESVAKKIYALEQQHFPKVIEELLQKQKSR